MERPLNEHLFERYTCIGAVGYGSLDNQHTLFLAGSAPVGQRIRGPIAWRNARPRDMEVVSQSR